MPDPSLLLIGFLASGGVGFLVQPRMARIWGCVARTRVFTSDEGIHITQTVDAALVEAETEKRFRELQYLQIKHDALKERLEEMGRKAEIRAHARRLMGERVDHMTGHVVQVWQERKPLNYHINYGTYRESIGPVSIEYGY